MSKKNGWSISFDIPGKPETKENSMGRAKNGAMFKIKRYHDWELLAHFIAIDAMKDAGWPGPYKGRCIIAADFCFGDWQKRDLTNFWKSLCDSLNGAVWVDDSQVDGTISIRTIDRKNPGIRVSIWFLDSDWDDYNRKYPETYKDMQMTSLSMLAAAKFVSKPEEAPAKRFGEYEYELGGTGTRSSKSGKKLEPRKMDRGRNPHEQAKAKAELSGNGCKNGTTRKRSSRGEPGGSERATR